MGPPWQRPMTPHTVLRSTLWFANGRVCYASMCQFGNDSNRMFAREATEDDHCLFEFSFVNVRHGGKPILGKARSYGLVGDKSFPQAHEMCDRIQHLERLLNEGQERALER